MYESSLAKLNFLINIIVLGQLAQIAEEFYNKDTKISVLDSSVKAEGGRNVMVKFRLDYDNREWVRGKLTC